MLFRSAAGGPNTVTPGLDVLDVLGKKIKQNWTVLPSVWLLGPWPLATDLDKRHR